MRRARAAVDAAGHGALSRSYDRAGLRRRSASAAPRATSTPAKLASPLVVIAQPPPPPPVPAFAPASPWAPEDEPPDEEPPEEVLPDDVEPPLEPVDEPVLPPLVEPLEPELPLEPPVDEPPELPPLPLLLLVEPPPDAPLLLVDPPLVPLLLPEPEPASSPPLEPVSHHWTLTKTLVVPPSSVVAGPPPPPWPVQTPPPLHACPRSAGGQYVPKISSQTAQALAVPVPPPEELVLPPLVLPLDPPLEPLPDPEPASKAHPFGSSQHVASTQVSPELPGQAWPTSESGHSVSAAAVRVKPRETVTRRAASVVRCIPPLGARFGPGGKSAAICRDQGDGHPPPVSWSA